MAPVVPFLGAADAEPFEPRVGIGQHAGLDRRADRFVVVGAQEQLFLAVAVAARALIERALDAIVGTRLAPGDGGGEVRPFAAPAIERGGGDLEEIGDIGIVQAMGVELAGLGGVQGPVAKGTRFGRCGRAGGLDGFRGDSDGRGDRRNSLFRRLNREIFFFSGRSRRFFARITSRNQGVEGHFPVLAEQGIRRDGTGKCARGTGNWRGGGGRNRPAGGSDFQGEGHGHGPGVAWPGARLNQAAAIDSSGGDSDDRGPWSAGVIGK
jgi:hypothetical protein